MRPSKRSNDEMRSVNITRNYNKYAEGSVLVEFGETKVICTASIVNTVPRFLKDTKRGWLTAEYGMLPRATGTRNDREAARGKQNGRTVEIQRLIGRALRSVVDLSMIGENTITVDCDVIQADGGTRTAAITGACVAVVDAVKKLQQKLGLLRDPFKQLVAAVSVGIFDGSFVLDLDYAEDSKAHVDMNVVMLESGGLIELQGTAEQESFSRQELDKLVDLAQGGLQQLFAKQRAVLGM